MRPAERQVEFLAGLRNAIADALKLEALAIPLGDAQDHVVQKRPREAVRRALFLRVALALDDELTVLQLHGHVTQDRLLELTLGAFDLHEILGNVDVDAAGNRYG